MKKIARKARKDMNEMLCKVFSDVVKRYVAKEWPKENKATKKFWRGVLKDNAEVGG